MDSFKAFDLADGMSTSIHQKRQQGILAIPTTYLGLNSGPKPAILVAIVLGSVAGFLFIGYLIYAILRLGGGIFNRRRTVEEVEVVERRSTSGRRRRPGTVYEREEDVIVEKRTSVRPGSRYNARTRETSRGNVEADDISL